MAFLSCCNLESRGGAESLGNTRRNNEHLSVNLLWMANSILQMAKIDWKADVHSHILYWQIGKIGKKGIGREMTKKNFPDNPEGGPSWHIYITPFTFAKRFHSYPLVGHSDYTGCWANGSVLPVEERDEISKATPWEILRRARDGIHREVLPKIP